MMTEFHGAPTARSHWLLFQFSPALPPKRSLCLSKLNWGQTGGNQVSPVSPSLEEAPSQRGALGEHGRVFLWLLL